MKRKTEILLVFGLATVITYFLLNKLHKRKSTDYESIKKLADNYFEKEDYENALLYHRKCKYMADDQDAIDKYNICLFKLGKYEDCLEEIKGKTNNLEIIKIRSECYKILGMERMQVKDLSLIETYYKNDKKQAEVMEMVKRICEKEAMIYIDTEGIQLNKTDILRGLVSIKGVKRYYEVVMRDISKNNCTVKIEKNCKSDGKSKCTETSPESSIRESDNSQFIEAKKHTLEDPEYNEKYNMMHALIQFFYGKYDKSLDLLQNSTYKYSVLLKAYILKFLDLEISFDVPGDDDVTSLYFSSKIYREKAEEYLLKAIKKCSKMPLSNKDFLYSELILFYVSNKDTGKVNSIINEVVDIPTPFLANLIGEYYLKIGELQKLMDFVAGIDDSPGKRLLLALYNLTVNKEKEAVDILYKCIVDFPSYFKAYLYLGNILIGENLEESKRLFNTAIKHSSCFDEVAAIKQSLMVIEIHEYIKEQNLPVKIINKN